MGVCSIYVDWHEVLALFLVSQLTRLHDRGFQMVCYVLLEFNNTSPLQAENLYFLNRHI